MLKPFLASILLSLVAAPLLAEPSAEKEAAAQQAEREQKWSHFAPKGWKVVMATTGSLLSAKSQDAVLVIENTDPAKIISNDRLGAATLNTNLRAILLLNNSGNGYAVKRRFDGFMPSEGDAESPCLADPLMEGPGIEIKKQILHIGLQYWYSCGSWYVTRDTFHFRPEKDQLRLIGIDSWTFHRASGIGNTSSVNFLNGRRKDVQNAVGLGPEPELKEDDKWVRPSTRWTRFRSTPIYLDEKTYSLCVDSKPKPGWCGL